MRRIALVVALIAAAVAGDGFPAARPSPARAQMPSSRPVDGFSPAERSGSAYKNVDPEYRRASPARRE